jgi:hypothetical protein
VPAEPEFESGQILVDKDRCWPALRLALWFNEHSDFYYDYLHGDKDTFSLAFHRLKTPFCLVPHPPQKFIGGLYQHDFAGRRLFQHRNLSKWTLLDQNQCITGFEFENECLADLERLKQQWDGRMFWLRAQFSHRRRRRLPRKPASVTAWMITCAERRETCRMTLASLAGTDWPDLSLKILVDPETAGDRRDRISQQVLRAMQQFLDESTHYLFLLEDDLIFNRHLRHNLERWRPFSQHNLGVGGLYNPGLRELAFDIVGRAVAVAPPDAFGTQALLLSRPTVIHATAEWGSLRAPADLRLMHLAGQLGQPVYYHTPSLVQHRQQPSLSEGRKHKAADFDLDWQA